MSTATLNGVKWHLSECLPCRSTGHRANTTCRRCRGTGYLRTITIREQPLRSGQKNKP